MLFLVWFVAGSTYPLWGVVNFMPYAALPFLWARGLVVPKRPVLLGLSGAVVAVLELLVARSVRGDYLALPNYARLSVILLSAGLFCAILAARRLPAASFLETVGTYSLGLYVFHTFALYLTIRLFPPSRFAVSGGALALSFIASALALAMSVALAWGIRRTPLRRMVA